MAACVFFHSFMDDLAEGVFTFATDTIRLGLSNTAPTAATDDEWSDITEISTGNGYTGPQALDNQTSTQTSGTYSFNADDEVFTASGGAIATFRYVVMYDDDATNDELICYWDYGSGVDLADGESLTVDFTTAILQWASS